MCLYVLVCYSYALVSRLLVCSRMLFVCTPMYPYAARMYSCGVLVTVILGDPGWQLVEQDPRYWYNLSPKNIASPANIASSRLAGPGSPRMSTQSLSCFLIGWTFYDVVWKALFSIEKSHESASVQHNVSLCYSFIDILILIVSRINIL